MQSKSEEPSLAEWQAEINKQQRELVAMQASVPSSVNLGLTALQIGKVRLQRVQNQHAGETLASLLHRWCSLHQSAKYITQSINTANNVVITLCGSLLCSHSAVCEGQAAFYEMLFFTATANRCATC